MMRRRLQSLVLAGLIGAGLARAQVADPTRPAGALTNAESTPGAAPTPAESGVQTVILRRGGKSAAVINGQYVAVGGKVGDKQVLKISETEIVLKGEGGREVIKVMPAVEKTPAKRTAGVKQQPAGTVQR